MTTISRRSFLATAAATVVATRMGAQSQTANQVSLTIPAEATGPHMPADFVGLSYEVQQLNDPSFFSLNNTGLIREFKAISSHGVLRLGGNTSEFAYWQPTLNSPEPEHPKTRTVIGEPKPQYYSVTEEAVRNLAAFLKETGWTCLYGIGMGTNTPERAADEAVFVAKTLGARLQYFQIGNEVDMFDRHLRDPKTWSAKTYLDRVAHPRPRHRCPCPPGKIRHARCGRKCRLAYRNRRHVAFHPASTPRHHPYAPLLLRRPGHQPRSQHSQPAQARHHGQGAEDLRHRHRRRTQNGRTCAHDRRQHLLSRRQTRCLRCLRRRALGCRLLPASRQQQLLRHQSPRWHRKVSREFSGRLLARRSAPQRTRRHRGADRNAPTPVLHAHRHLRFRIHARARSLRTQIRRSLERSAPSCPPISPKKFKPPASTPPHTPSSSTAGKPLSSSSTKMRTKTFT